MYNPGIEYRGDQSLFAGATAGIGNLQKYALGKLDEYQQHQIQGKAADTTFEWMKPLLQQYPEVAIQHADQLAKFHSHSSTQRQADIGGLTIAFADARAKRIEAQKQGFNSTAAEAFSPDGNIDFSKIGAAVKQFPGGFDPKQLIDYFDKAQAGKAKAAELQQKQASETALSKFGQAVTDTTSPMGLSYDQSAPSAMSMQDRILRAISGNPGALNAPGFADAAKALTAAGKTAADKKPEETVTSEGRKVLYSPDTGQFQILKDPNAEMSSYQRSQIELSAMRQLVGLGNPLQTADMTPDQKDQARSRLEGIMGNKTAAGGGPTKSKPPLTTQAAKDFLNQAGGDKTKARKMAKDAGYDF
jgi:hypothetical protein